MKYLILAVTTLFRTALAFLLAVPAGVVAYNLINPPSLMLDTAGIYIEMTQRLEALIRHLGGPGADLSSLNRYVSPATDWAQVILFITIAFLAFGLFLRGWRFVPLFAMLTVPAFEGLRHYRLPVELTAENALAYRLLQLVLSPPLLVFFVVFAFWRLLIYGRMIRYVGWRWTAGAAILALLVAFGVYFTPFGFIFRPESTRYPGSVWLVPRHCDK